MLDKLQEWARSLALLFVPADDDPPANPEADPPAEPAADPATDPPAEGTAEPAQASTQEEMVPKAELDRLREEHEARVHQEAEELLMRVVPEAYPGPGGQPAHGQQPPQQAAPEPNWNDLSDEERQNYLRQQNEQLIRDQQDLRESQEAQRIIDRLQNLKRDQFPELNVRECLEVLATRPNARIDRLAELSHRNNITRQDQIAQRRLSDPRFREAHGLPPIEQDQSGAPAQPSTAPAQRRAAPRLPGTGPTTTSAEPITTKNARHVLRDRLRAAGFEDRGPA